MSIRELLAVIEACQPATQAGKKTSTRSFIASIVDSSESVGKSQASKSISEPTSPTSPKSPAPLPMRPRQSCRTEAMNSELKHVSDYFAALVANRSQSLPRRRVSIRAVLLPPGSNEKPPARKSPSPPRRRAASPLKPEPRRMQTATRTTTATTTPDDEVR